MQLRERENVGYKICKYQIFIRRWETIKITFQIICQHPLKVKMKKIQYILGSTHYSLKRHQKTLNVKREKTSVRHSWETYAYDSQHWEQVSKVEAGS